MSDPARVHRFSRRLSVRAIAFALRHGMDEAECMRALSMAYRCEHCGPRWRLAIIEDARLRNLRRDWRGRLLPWPAPRRTPRG